MNIGGRRLITQNNVKTRWSGADQRLVCQVRIIYFTSNMEKDLRM